MTSEVLLMNRGSIAMAADSAVTIMGEHGHTIYKSVDKVFQLVEGQPIGVMIYNFAEIMDTPWESVISLYRKQSAGRRFDTVEEYARDFFKFLDGNRDLFPPDAQKIEYFRMVALLYGALVREFEGELMRIAESGEREYRKHAQEVFAYVCREVHSLYQTQYDGTPRPDLTCFPEGLGERLRKTYRAEIDQIIDSLNAYMAEHFQGFAIKPDERALLRDMAAFVVTKDAFFEGYTGLVFAGFGAKEKFPAMVSYFASGVLEDRVKRSIDRQRKITSDSGPAIMSFAQDRMVHTLVRGIDPDLRYHFFMETLKLSRSLVSEVVQSIRGLKESDQARYIAKFSEENLSVALAAFFRRIDEYQQEVHTDPILRALDSLPRMELAETAASLVKLNSFQLRVTGQPETVGGPVDVAVISLHDGLVMISDSHTYA